MQSHAVMNFTNISADKAIGKDAYDLPFRTWVVYMTFSVLLILTALYVFLTLLHYTFVKNLQLCTKRHLRGSASTRDREYNSSSIGGNGRGGSASSGEESKRKRSDGTGKAATPLRILCLLAAFFALTRIGADQLELATYGGDRVDCKLYQVIVVVTYALSATCNYSALWVRLRIFFNHPIMNHLATHSINFFIWLALSLILGSTVLNTLIFLITVTSIESRKGCILGETTSISPTVRYVILTLSSLASQGIVLGLFLYPLVKHRTSMKITTSKKKQAGCHPRIASIANQETKSRKSVQTESDSDVASVRSKSDARSFRRSKRVKRERRLIAIMRRVLFTALVCSISDVIAAVITIALSKEPRVVTNMVFNFNLLLNIVSVLLSFGDWQERLAPCFKPKNKDSPKRRSAMIAQLANEKMQKDVTNNNDKWRHGIESTVSGANPIPSSPMDSISKNDDVFTDSRDDVA